MPAMTVSWEWMCSVSGRAKMVGPRRLGSPLARAHLGVALRVPARRGCGGSELSHDCVAPRLLPRTHGGNGDSGIRPRPPFRCESTLRACQRTPGLALPADQSWLFPVTCRQRTSAWRRSGRDAHVLPCASLPTATPASLRDLGPEFDAGSPHPITARLTPVLAGRDRRRGREPQARGLGHDHSLRITAIRRGDGSKRYAVSRPTPTPRA